MAKIDCPSDRTRKTSREIEEEEKKERRRIGERGKQKSNRELVKTREFETEAVKWCERVKKGLKEWTSFREMQQIVVHYVNKVIFKMNYDGYTRRKQVFEDICNFKALRIKLEAEENYYPIAVHGSEILLGNAMKKLAKMLLSFSRMLHDGKVSESHKTWIHKQLKKGLMLNSDPTKLLQTAYRNIKHTEESVKRYDQDIQSEIKKQTKQQLQRLMDFPVNVNKYRAGNFVERKNEFKLVKKQISREENNLKELSLYLAAYNSTMEDIRNSEGSDADFFPSAC